MDYSELIKTLDTDIDKQHTKASEMIAAVQVIFLISIIMLFIYIAPGVSERALPYMQEKSTTKEATFNKAVIEFESKYQSKYHYISDGEYKVYVEKNALNEKIKVAKEISEMDKGKSTLLDVLILISKLKVEDSKIEFILNILPYILGSILAGFFIAYRLHVIAAKELASKKFDIIAKSFTGSKQEK